MKRWWLTIMSLAFSGVMANNSFLVAPTHVDVNLQHRFTQSFMVTNTGPNRIHIRIKPIFLRVNSRSLRLGQPISQKLSNEADLSPYVMVSPEALSLMPGQERDVRMSVHAPAALPDGGYRAHLLFHMINLQRKEVKQLKNKRGQGMKVALNMLMEMAISVYGYKGESQAHFKAQCHYHKHTLTMDLTNNSPWRFVGNFHILAQGHNKAVKQHVLVLRDSVEKIKVKSIAKAKRYTVLFKGKPHLGGEGQFSCNVG